MKKSFTIYYFCFEGFKKIGRLNNHITETVNWFAEFGNDVHFFNPKIINPDLDKKVKLHLIPILNLPILKWIIFDILSFWMMITNIFKNKPDVIYYRESSSLVPLIVSKLFSIPLFVEINGWVLDELSEIDYPKLKLKLVQFTQKLNYENADKIIPVSDGLKNLVLQHYNVKSGKIKVVNNGTNPKKYYPIAKKTARKKIGFSLDDKIIGFIGGCYPHHGIHHLIKATPYILKNQPSIKFVIAGDGVMLNEWKKLAKKLDVHDNYYFPGNVPYELAPYYINSFDICVAPWEANTCEGLAGSPMKLFDYLICARPTITSSLKNINAIITKNSIGSTVEVTNPEKFSEAIIHIFNNYDMYQEMANKGREYVINNYTWEQTAKKINELFYETCNNK